MNKKTKQFIAACAVPVLILLGMCFTPMYTLIRGEEIVLSTIPVDPTDLFRGDYVTLRYEAEEVPKELVEDAVIKKLKNHWGEIKVYVPLEEQNGIYAPSKVTLTEPERGIYLAGILDYIGTNGNAKQAAFIHYNLDKYYVQDNMGTAWEKASVKGQILAKVKVNHGYALLTDIMMK